MTRILASRIEEAHNYVAKANRKLEKAGIADRFELVIGESKEVKVNNGSAIAEYVTKVEVELNVPEISFGGFTFVATLIDESGDIITRVAPGQDLKGYRPKDAVCDHCGITRQRNKTYIVRDADGKISQVGSSCIRLFLGFAPTSLWTLEYDLAEFEASEGEGGYSNGGTSSYDVRELIALAYAITDGGKGYRSARSCEYSGVPTSSRVWFHLYPRFEGFKNAAEEAAARAEHHAIIAAKEAVTAETIDAVIASAATLSSDTDYGSNMQILVGKERVTSKSVNMLISILAVFTKERTQRAEKAAKVQGFIGEAGDKVEGIEAVVTDVKPIESTYGYRTTTTYLHTFNDAAGHVIKWFASRHQGVDIDDKVIIVKATVKGQDHFAGQDQTLITRATLKKI